MTIIVLDGQGGGIGRQLVEALKRAGETDIACVGTNAIATAAMLRAGADQGATGESAIRHQCKSADIIVGVVGILHANAMLGEISPAVALAVGLSDAHKVLIPLERCGLTIAGVARQPLDALIADAAAHVAALAAGKPCQTETQERT